MSYYGYEEGIKKKGKGETIQFFDSLEKWKAALKKMHPKSDVTVINGVHRAYLGKLKVGVFGRFPGYGYLGGEYLASMISPVRGKLPMHKETK